MSFTFACGGGMMLPANPSQWDERWRDDLAERRAIMEAEGVADAYQKAVQDVRRVAEREQGELFGGEI